MRTRAAAIAVALVSAVTATGLLTACDPTAKTTGNDPSSPAAAPSQQPVSGGATTGNGGAAPAPAGVNLTGGTQLTISNGSSKVVMDGKVVDFGVVVRDLAWSPDGKHAAFVDGNGNLDVADADGSGRVVVAVAPSGDNWSHPAWQVTPKDKQYGFAARDNIFFVANHGGVTKLLEIAATQHHGTPTALSLNSESGAGVTPLPLTGNIWVNGGDPHGKAVYANTGDGKVYIRDDYLRQQGSAATNGSEPALIPNDGGIVFVRSVAGHDHVFVDRMDSPSGAVVDLTPNATTDYTEPAVSPDGQTVAMRTPNGVVVVPINGSAAPKLVSSTPGLPAYR